MPGATSSRVASIAAKARRTGHFRKWRESEAPDQAADGVNLMIHSGAVKRFESIDCSTAQSRAHDRRRTECDHRHSSENQARRGIGYRHGCGVKLGPLRIAVYEIPHVEPQRKALVHRIFHSAANRECEPILECRPDR